MRVSNLKDAEGLLSGNHALGFMCDNIEADRLGQRAALAHGDNVSFLDGKGRTAVHGNVLVTLLETTVLGDVVQVIPSDDNRSLHFGGNDESLEDASADGHISGKGALLVDIVALNGGSRCLDAETYILEESHGLFLGTANGALASDKDGILLLVSLFVLVALDVFTGDAGHVASQSSGNGKIKIV